MITRFLAGFALVISSAANAGSITGPGQSPGGSVASPSPAEASCVEGRSSSLCNQSRINSGGRTGHLPDAKAECVGDFAAISVVIDDKIVQIGCAEPEAGAAGIGAGCVGGDQAWGAGCTGARPSMSNGESYAISNRVDGKTGAVMLTCVNGVVQTAGASCQ